MLKDIIPFAQNLPVWVSKSKRYLTAVNALAAVNDSLVLPWSPNFDRFVRPDSDHGALKALGVPLFDDETMLKDRVLGNLPAKIDGANKAGYLRVIAAMSASNLMNSTGIVSLLRERRLAATREGLMVRPGEIYDHSDEIFVAAFRLEATNHFLLEDAEDFHSFWRKAGLRCRNNGKLLGVDYVTCLRAILKRFRGQDDSYLEADVDEVLRPLCATPYTLSDISSTDWSQLSTIEVFPLLSDLQGQPSFRRERMESLAASSKALSLAMIRSKNHIRVCWSQIPFTSSEPGSEVLGRVPGSGDPNCAIVWQHLEYLAEISATLEDSEVEPFLLDLVESYEYLQARLQESKDSFRFPKSAVWLNVDKSQGVSSYELQHSWQRLNHLILLSACDAPPP
jgi:sacsin